MRELPSSRYLVYFYTMIVFLDSYILSNGIPHSLTRRSSSHLRSRPEDLVNLPYLADFFDANDIFLADFVDNRLRNRRSAPTMPLPSDSSNRRHKPTIETQQEPLRDLSQYPYHPYHQEDEDEDDPSQLKFKIRKYAAKAQNPDVNKDSRSVITTVSPINENKNYARAIQAMLIILQATPALSKEIYNCLRDSPVFRAVIQSLQRNIPSKNDTATSIPVL